MKLFELDKPKKISFTRSILALLEAEVATQVQELKNNIIDMLLSYKTTATGNPNIPLDKFLKSLSIPGLDIEYNKPLVIEIIESLTDIVKEVNVPSNKIVLKSALTLRNKNNDPEKSKEKVAKMSSRAIKRRIK